QDTPWYFFDDPVMELTYRRPLAEAKAKAEEARVKAEEEAREARAREKREREEEGDRYARDTRREEREAHVGRTRRAGEGQEEVEGKWGEGGSAKEERALIYTASGDCGRKHWTHSAACACANVRNEERARASRMAAAAAPPPPPTRPVQTKPVLVQPKP